MKYLKTYKFINESTFGDLSFDDFKDILIDITDKLDNFDYYKQNNLYQINIRTNIPDFLLNKDVYDVINSKETELNSINKQITEMSKLIELIKDIEENVITRLITFDNCLEVQIGLYKVGAVNKWEAEIILQYIIR